MAGAFLSHSLTSGRTQLFNVTDFYSIGGRLTGITVETSAQITKRVAGVLSAMSVYILTNTLDNTTTCRSRVNTANGNQTFTFAAGATGYFRDLTNTDTIAAGDKINWTMVTTTSTSGQATPIAFTGIFTATTNTNKVLASTATAGTAYTSSNVSAFVPIGGDVGQTPTEANTQCKMQGTGTLQNLFLRISTNTRTTTTNFYVRLNGADTAITAAVGAGATGFFEDTANTQAVVPTDLLNYRIIGGVEVNSINLTTISVGHTSTDNTFPIVSSVLNGGAVAASASRFFPASGGMPVTSTEANAQMETNLAFTASKLTLNVSVNGGTTNGSFTLRTGLSTNTAVTGVITALTTGFFDSGATTAGINAGDIITVNCTGGATAGTTVQTITMLGMVPAAAGTVVSMRTLMGVGI